MPAIGKEITPELLSKHLCNHGLRSEFNQNHPDWGVPSKMNKYRAALSELRDMGYNTSYYFDKISNEPLFRLSRRPDTAKIVGGLRKYNKINVMCPTYKRAKTKLPTFVRSAVSKSDGKICFTFCVNKHDRETALFIKEEFAKNGVDFCVIFEDEPAPHLARFYNSMYYQTKFRDDDIMVSMFGDDMVFETQGWDTRVLNAASKTDGKVIVYCNDAYVAGDTCCVNMCTTRHLVKATKYPFMCTRYPMEMIDVVWTMIGDKIGRLRYLNDVIVRHEHAGKVGKDETFNRLQTQHGASYSVSKQYLEEYVESAVKNINENWEPSFDTIGMHSGSPVEYISSHDKPVLSILICHIPERVDCMYELGKELHKQCKDKPVEVIVDSTMGITTGQKRNAMIAVSKGKYVCFVDDDDKVSPDYVDKILAAADEDKHCVSIQGEVIEKDGSSKPFFHSIKYDRWGYDEKSYFRNPNHLNPVIRDIATKHPFPEIMVGEDNKYSMAIYPDLKTEAKTTGTLYYYIQ